MRTVKPDQMPEFDNPHGVSARRLHQSDDVSVTHIALEPGEKLRTHTTPVDVFFYALEGEGIVEIGEERERIGADTLVPSPAGIPHRLINEGTERFRFLVVKIPGRS